MIGDAPAGGGADRGGGTDRTGDGTGGRVVILVYSTSHAIALEKLLKARNVGTALVPVPRHLSSDCGICVRISSADEAEARACVEESGIEIQGIFAV